MFNFVEYRIIREHCLEDLKVLLNALAIPMPIFKIGEEIQISKQLDVEITKKICARMKSITIITGYLSLLKLGHIQDRGDELYNELLALIVQNEDKIIEGAPEGPPPPPPPPPPIVKEEHVLAILPLIFGGIFSIGTLFYTISAEDYFPLFTILGMIVGLGGLGIGLKGEKRIRLIDAPEPPAPPPFHGLTKADVRVAIDTLKLVNNIVVAMTAARKIVEAPPPPSSSNVVETHETSTTLEHASHGATL